MNKNVFSQQLTQIQEGEPDTIDKKCWKSVLP